MGKWIAGEVTLPPIEFDGDTITVKVKRLRVDALAKMSSHFDMKRGLLSFASHIELCKVAADVLPEYVVSIDGMTKGDGTQFTKDEFCEVIHEFYFTPLIGQILTGMIEVSTVGAPQAKN